MNKRNYRKELDIILDEIKKDGVKKKLLLHSCCAPCSSYTLLLLADYFDITDLYFNPNISPETEYTKRVEEQRRFIETINEEYGYHIEFIEGRYEPKEFYEKVKGLEDVPEGGERCFICYEMRMREAAEYAAKLGTQYFTTTLSISPLKNAEKINEIGQQLAKEYGVIHLPSDFKKKDGYKKSIELSAKYELYRQNYCGCIYSRNDSVNF